ncbi:MAG: autotransporter domain-containing protein [Azospirillum sp.]|nr:autotransporter domain-containing protein [Azospirillum sp.]
MRTISPSAASVRCAASASAVWPATAVWLLVSFGLWLGCASGAKAQSTYTTLSGAAITVTPAVSNIGTGGASNGASSVTFNGLANSYTATFTGDAPLSLNAASGQSIIMVGTNSISNAVGIDSGTIQVQGTLNAQSLSIAGPATLSNSGTIAADSLTGSGALVLNTGSSFSVGSNDANSTFSGVIGGNGSFTKAGNGTLVLSGANTFTGSATVAAGALRVDNQLPAAVTITSGGILMGNGTVSSIANFGTVAPGASIGTLHVSGNYVQHADGVLAVEIDAAGNADKLVVSGTASLDGAVKVLPETGTYVSGTRYNVLTAQSVSGTFRTVAVENQDRLGGLAVGVEYLGNGVDLVLMPSAVASERQQTESVASVAPQVTRTVTQTVTNNIAARIAARIFAYGPISGAGFGTGSGSSRGPGTGAGLFLPDLHRAAALGLSGGDDASDPEQMGLSAWADTSLSLLDDTRLNNKSNGWLTSTVFGIDARVDEHVLVGATVGPDYTHVNLRSVDGQQTQVAGTMTVYGAYQFDDHYYISAIAGYGRGASEVSQPISGQAVTGTYGSERYIFNLSSGGNFAIDEQTRSTVTLGYTLAIDAPDPYHSSDGARVGLPSTQLGTLRLGGQVEYAATESAFPFVAAAFERDLVNSKGSANRTGYQFGGGFNYTMDGDTTAGLVANTSFGRGKESQHQFGANLRVRF